MQCKISDRINLWYNQFFCMWARTLLHMIHLENSVLRSYGLSKFCFVYQYHCNTDLWQNKFLRLNHNDLFSDRELCHIKRLKTVWLSNVRRIIFSLPNVFFSNLPGLYCVVTLIVNHCVEDHRAFCNIVSEMFAAWRPWKQWHVVNGLLS